MLLASKLREEKITKTQVEYILLNISAMDLLLISF